MVLDQSSITISGPARERFCDVLLLVGTYSFIGMSITLFYQHLNNQFVNIYLLFSLLGLFVVTFFVQLLRCNFFIKSIWLITILFITTILLYLNRGLFSLAPIIGFITIVTSNLLISRNLYICVLAGQTFAVWAAWFIHIYYPDIYNLNSEFLISNLVLSRAVFITVLYLTYTIAMHKLLERLHFESESFAEDQSRAIQNELEITNLLTFANAPIFSINNKLIINQWNHALETITGYHSKEAIGNDFVANFVAEDSKKSLSQVFKDTLLGLESTSFQTTLLSKTEQRIEILLNTSCRRNSKGEVLGVLCLGQDVTKLRKQEAMLNHSQKMDSLGYLTGGIAHDFNNLLMIIQGNIDLLRGRFKGSKADTEEILNDVHAATVRGAGLISQLLSFAGKKNMASQSIEINTAIRDSSRIIGRTLGASIGITLQLSDEALFCDIDVSLLESALINLSINARDAMEEGNGKLMFTSSKETIALDRAKLLHIDSGEYITVSLTDNGAGISPENISRIIEPFFSTKNRAEASGLGLSMVHGFTRQCKGALDIQSEPGRGTTVSLIIPSIPAETIESI